MKWLELRVPPPVVAATVALLMWLAALPFPALGFELPAVAGAPFLGVALVIGAAAITQFRKAKTTINPMTPEASSALVSGGVFRFTRNPMYLAMLFVLAGWACIVSNLAALAMLPLFVAYLNRFQIGPEERALHARFGAGYQRYRESVRRWL